jgi:hypothetical protein
MESQPFVPEIKIEFWWRPTAYKYPDPIPNAFKAQYFGAAVYRWAVYPPGSTNPDPSEHYIGETAKLTDRLRKYLSPGARPSTHRRLKQALDDRLIAGSRIELHTLQFRPFQIATGDDSVPVRMADLDDPFTRKMMENFAILAKPRYCRLLNIVIDPISRRIRKAEETRRLLAAPDGRKRLYEDRDVKTVLEIMKRRDEMDRNAKAH